MFYPSPWMSFVPFQMAQPAYHVIDTRFYPYSIHHGQASAIPNGQQTSRWVRSEPVPDQHTQCISRAELELNQTFRMLWEQHVAWTRMLIISIAEELGDEEQVTKRLLRNPGDMAAVFKRYYGDKVAAQFNRLMTEHLVLAAQLVKAAKAGKSQAAAELEKKWYANADELAAFMSSINPYWPKAVLTQLLHEHLRMTKDEAVFRLSKKYESDIAAYDGIERQALEMADAFTDGIVRQFPNQFQ